MPETSDAPTSDNRLTICFVGLCMFAKVEDREEIHVLLPQPQHMPMAHGASHEAAHRASHAASDAAAHETPLDMTHRATLVSRRGRGNGWSASQIAPGSLLEFRARAGAFGMPPSDQMANVSDMPDGKSLPQKDAKPDKKLKGACICLYGGAVTALDEIGIWDVDNPDGSTTEVCFPYLLAWTGQAADGEVPGFYFVWNATEEESPTLGDNCIFPDKQIDPVKAAQMAAAHFKAYYRILANVDGPKITFRDKKPAGGTWRPLAVPGGPASLVVASCPLARARLV